MRLKNVTNVNEKKPHLSETGHPNDIWKKKLNGSVELIYRSHRRSLYMFKERDGMIERENVKCTMIKTQKLRG